MARLHLWWLGVLGAACGARELDPAACAARFDVQRDKIIRTEESRDMGARYLSELDVGARTECLRLCCETESCDVFVYEEKGPGSCYLFDCGPPEDFRCKFTAHGNFSSGVLALGRRQAERQDRERLALASLRGASSTLPPPAPPPPTSQRSPPAPPALPPASPPHPDLLLTPGRCSRYQFECRRGGECVAVYNACDGVPQCADGSDEAPELGCPPPAPAPAPTPAPTAPRPQLAPPPPLLLQESQESQERAGASEGSDAETGAAGAGAGPGAGAGERERWPHRLAQAQPQHRYSEGASSSHIFSHKGGLLQETEAAQPAPEPYPPFEPPWPRRAWTQHQNSESMGGWGDGSSGVGSGVMYPRPRLEWGEGAARRAWPVPPAPAPAPASAPIDPEGMYLAGETAPAYASRAATLRDSAKKGPAPVLQPRPSPPAPPASPAAPVSAPRHDAAKPKPHKDKVAQPGPGPGPGLQAGPGPGPGGGGRGAGAEARVADGLSEHPPAAVLLLVLGMVMTVGMGGMLGCRMGAARRRLRRGKPFAHDADYLVNGMYL